MFIPASKSGKIVQVEINPEDYEKLRGRKVSIGSHGYAQIYDQGKVTLLHRWILGMKVGDRLIADHIDGNPMNCKRSNLRIVTGRHSNKNRLILVSKYGTGVRKVRSGRFQARVKVYGKEFHLGTYDTPQEAWDARLRFLRGK